MPIAALPSNTVRAIGSSQVLTDSCSVVKELIDNALDGRSTSIFVEISPNALDIIQVKDNGHGIAPGDRDMLGMRYCTSKIRGLEELTNIGGRSLGFRGEALASAAEMSGSMVISTRIEGESTATSIKIKRDGGIESKEKTSHPVGTTVRIGDFLKALPVRRQTALKAPVKLLSKIKRILHAYALARPSIRFSLKVLKAKNDKGNWMYASRRGATSEAVLTDAAVKVVGKKVAEQSKWIVWSSSSIAGQIANNVGKTTENEVYRIEALLPVAACDTSYISNIGQFVSIDSRPVSCTRGTLKQMVNLYKSYLRSSSSLSNGQTLVDPFLCMNIICPQGSYDVNVEPAKDDVLFTNNDLFLKVIEGFFSSVYGELRVIETENIRSKSLKPRSEGFELLLARKPTLKAAAVQKQYLEGSYLSRHTRDTPSATSNLDNRAASGIIKVSDPEAKPSETSLRSPQTADRYQIPLQTSPVSEIVPGDNDRPINNSAVDVKRRPWKRNMYADDDDVHELYPDLDAQNKLSAETEFDNEESLRDMSVSNPWAFAKLNAPIRPLRKERAAEAALDTNGQLFTPVRQRGEASDDSNPSDVHDHVEDILMGDPPNPERLRAAVLSATELQSSSPEPFPYPLKAWGKGESSRGARKPPISDRDRYGSGALDTWVQKSLNSHTSTPDNDEISLLGSNAIAASHARDFVSARTLPIGTPLSDILRAAPRSGRKPGPRKQQQSSIDKPFVSPLNDSDRVWFDIEPKRRSKPTRPARSENGIDTTAADTPIRNDSDDDSIAEPRNGAAPSEPMHSELASIMDYEIRKQAAFEQRKKYLRQQAAAAKALNQTATEEPLRPQTSNTSPHKNRYHKAIAALRPADETSADPRLSEQSPVFETGDPRAYLIRAQQRDNAERQTTPAGISPAKKRRKTAMLPLETINDDRTTRNLTLKVATSPRDLRDRMAQAAISDDYVTSGTSNEAFSGPTIKQVRMWEERLRALIHTTYTKEADSGDGRAEIRIDLWPALQTHLEAYTSA